MRSGHLRVAHATFAPRATRATLWIVALAWGPVCLAATVTLQAPAPGAGYIAVPISLAPGTDERVASLQFDMAFDGTAFQVDSIKPGPSALNASKDVMFSVPDNGTVRVIVAGLNQNVVGEGVIATVYLTRTTGDAALPTVGLSSIIVSDPTGEGLEALYEEDSQELEPTEEDTPSDTSSSRDTSTSIGKDTADASSAADTNYASANSQNGLISGGAYAPHDLDDLKESPETDANPAGIQGISNERGSSRLTSPGVPGEWSGGSGPDTSGRTPVVAPRTPPGAPSPSPQQLPSPNETHPPGSDVGAPGRLASAASHSVAVLHHPDESASPIAASDGRVGARGFNPVEVAWPLAVAALIPLIWLLRPFVLKRMKK